MSSTTGEMTLEGKVRAPASPYRDSIMFRANPDQEGPGTRKILLRLDEEAVDHAQSKRELYWAGVLGETIAITVKTDPELPAKPLLDEHQHMLLTWHCLRDKRPMAQKVAERPDWPKLIPQLRGMMRASVLSAHPRELSRESLEFVGAHEVIIWEDGSMTTIEHSAAGVTGEFRDQRMLPHLPRAAQLLEHEELGPYGEPRDREPKDREQKDREPKDREPKDREPKDREVRDAGLRKDLDGLIDYGALRHVLERIVRPATGGAPPTPRAAARRALLGPALELAERARAELGRRMTGGEGE